MDQIREENKENYGEDNLTRLYPGFNLFNRRTEYPYDIIENPLKINPKEDRERD